MGFGFRGRRNREDALAYTCASEPRLVPPTFIVVPSRVVG